MYKNNKSQITVFLLLGIVLIAVFSSLFFVYYNVGKKKTQEEKKLGYSDLIQQTAIKFSINSCFASEIIKGLNFLAKQGGNIYKDQGGHIKSDFYLNYSGFSVNYGIKRREPDPKFFPLPVPDYPYLGKLEKQNFPYFGEDNIPGLCSPIGDNKDCPSYDIYNKSFEKQLQVYVFNGLKRCLNDVLIRQKYPSYNITASEEPEVKVLFAEKKIIFNLRYNISFVFADKILTGVEEFKIVQPIRIRYIHNFIKDVINNDIKNIKFDIVEGSYNLKTVKPGFKVSKVTEACAECPAPGKYDDIIIISDKDSLLDGKPYTFFFARQNRIPALELIKQEGLELITEYDMKFKDGDEIVIEPEAYDADEEDLQLVFDYFGWQQTQYEWYDLSAHKIKYDKTQEPEEWTNSKLYQEEYPSANYTTNFSDIGHHVVRVSVTDRQGLEDYQDVKIFVQDKPRFEVWGEHEFGGEEYYASIEDPYTLKAKVECEFCEAKEQLSDTKLHYRFFHTDEDDAYKELITTERTHELKKDINDPFSTPFNQPNDQVRLFVPDVSSIEVPYSDLINNVFECWPYENPGTAPYPYNDINYRNIRDQKQDYKYTKPFADNFTASHACCSGEGEKDIRFAATEDWEGGSFKGGGKVCFNIQYNTCNPRFLKDNWDNDPFYSKARLDIDGKLIELGSNIPLVQPADVNSPKRWNDIYKRTFIQYCSGNRGNACGGVIEQTYDFVKSCDDKEAGEDETCFGPKRGKSDSCFRFSSDCEAYSLDHSFETDFLLCDPNFYTSIKTTDGRDTKCDGICNENWRPASIYPPKFVNNGKWSCQALCGIDADNNRGCTYPDVHSCICNVAGRCAGENPSYLIDIRDPITQQITQRIPCRVLCT